MSNQHTTNDPMAKFALIAGLAILALTVAILLNSLFNTVGINSVKGEIDTQTLAANKAAMIEGNIKPIGEVATSDGAGAVAAADTAARSGEEVYKAVCAACHATGVALSPKFGDKAAWEPRVANGFDSLLNTAINGKGAMPPRAGQNISDAELKGAIIYMVKEAGLSLDVAEEAPATASASATTEQAAPAADTATTETTTTTASAEGEPAQPATPEAPAVPAAPETPAAPEVPTTPEAPSSPTKPTANAESTMKVATEAADVATGAVAAATEAAAPTAVEAKTEEAPSDTAKGEAIYNQTCFACHNMGVAGAPKLGDKELWAPRIATGNDALYSSAINGKTSSVGVMPPKGGNMSLSDDDIKAAVDFMVFKAQ